MPVRVLGAFVGMVTGEQEGTQGHLAKMLLHTLGPHPLPRGLVLHFGTGEGGKILKENVIWS